jgi:hypothetical protein
MVQFTVLLTQDIFLQENPLNVLKLSGRIFFSFFSRQDAHNLGKSGWMTATASASFELSSGP